MYYCFALLSVVLQQFLLFPLLLCGRCTATEKREEKTLWRGGSKSQCIKHSCTAAAAVVQRCKSVGFHHLLTNYLPSLSLFTVMTVGSFALLLCHHCNVEIPKKRAKLNQAFLRSQSFYCTIFGSGSWTSKSFSIFSTHFFWTCVSQ